MPQIATISAKTLGAAPGAVLRAPRLWKEAVELARTLAKDLIDPYRPERHYMRGPGPRWHEKHARSAAQGQGLLVARVRPKDAQREGRAST